MRNISSRTSLLIVAAALLACMEAAMLLSVRQKSQTSDEAYNLFGGYAYLTAGNYSIAAAHPPLAKDVAALPLLAMKLTVPPMTPAQTSDFRSGRIFLYANRAGEVLFSARAAMTVFPLLLALLVFLATWEMFGAGSAVIAIVLMAFEPNLIAHGALVTNDVALACCLFAAVYAFWRYADKPGGWALVICGVATGMTLGAKHSGLIIFPILFVLALVDLLVSERSLRDSRIGAHEHAEGNDLAAGLQLGTSHPRFRGGRVTPVVRLIFALIGVTFLAAVTLWGIYGFHYSPLAGAPAPSMAPLLDSLPNQREASAIAMAARARLLPEAFLDGLAFLFATDSRPTYLLGVRYPHGVWFYFPTVIFIKSTLGFLLLLLLIPFAKSLRERPHRRAVLWMLVPAVLFLAAAMTSNLDIGIRHILPVYPFLGVLAAAGASSLAQKHPMGMVVVSAILVIHVASTLRAYPNYLPYSNELWGGPFKTYRFLSDSNVDWGQDLPAVKRYLGTTAPSPCWFAYFGSVDPAYFDIPCKLLPVHEAMIWERPLDAIPPRISGTVLISATEMSGQLWGQGELNPYEQFRTSTPRKSLGGSIFVYEGSFDVPLASALSGFESDGARRRIPLTTQASVPAASGPGHVPQKPGR